MHTVDQFLVFDGEKTLDHLTLKSCLRLAAEG